MRTVHLLHGSREAVLRRRDEDGIVIKLVGDDDLFNLAAEELLEPRRQRLIHLLQLLELLLGHLVVRVEQLDVVLRNGLNLVLFVLGQVLRAELIDRVVHDEHLVTKLDVLLEDG